MIARRSFLAVSAAACLARPAYALEAALDLELVDRGRGQTLASWRWRGETWVAGRPGERYAVRMTNRTASRVLVVLSIDGINAVSGETAATAQTGYVLAPWQATEITGWRKSWTEAAAFYFAALPDSYAARTGRPDNVGVIGAAVFRERVAEVAAPAARLDLQQAEPPRQRDAEASARAASPAPAQVLGAARDERLGTGHGERVYAPVGQTTFERASDLPAEVLTLRYDSVEHLEALGVIRPRRAPLPRPEPFPASCPIHAVEENTRRLRPGRLEFASLQESAGNAGHRRRKLP